MVNAELRPQYQVVLDDLQKDRAELHRQVAEMQRQLQELDYNIASLSRRLIPSAPAVPVPIDQPTPQTPDSQKYAFISTRWCVLIELSQAGAPRAAHEIADALLAGGFRTRASNFSNNVSATLSSMKSGRGEVDVVDGKWTITEVGRSAAHHIMTTKLRKTFGRYEKTEVPGVAPLSTPITKGANSAAP
jgi:hypothetical protein